MTLPMLLPGLPEPRHCESCGRSVPKGPLVEGLGSGCAREHGITPPSIARSRSDAQDGPNLLDLINSTGRRTPVPETLEHATCRRRTHTEDLAVHQAQQRRQPDDELHARAAHPDWDYTLTEGPRKQWVNPDQPPGGDGWIRNRHMGRDGWERYDYTEAVFWMRPKRQGSEGG